jgi:hypothetical protein
MSPRNQGLPVPSTIRPLSNTRSNGTSDPTGLYAFNAPANDNVNATVRNRKQFFNHLTTTLSSLVIELVIDVLFITNHPLAFLRHFDPSVYLQGVIPT